MDNTVSSGITSNGIILENDTMIVLDGVIGTDTMVNARGWIFVSSGGTANSTRVSSCGYLCAGNDRITGASGNDVIAGGIGDDRLHGGGGDDVFTFCENWGTDTVKQLGTGTVTLWFESGSIDNWDEETLTYSDGDNCVKVSGVAVEQVTLKFGAGATPDDADQFASLSSMGAFEAFTTRKIFEEATLA